MHFNIQDFLTPTDEETLYKLYHNNIENHNIIIQDVICQEWMDIWYSLIKTEITTAFDFSVLFCNQLRDSEKYETIVKITFILVVHVFIIDKIGDERENSAHINEKLATSIRHYGLDECSIESLFYHLSLWMKSREYEKNTIKANRTLLTWVLLEWRQINAGIAHICYAIFYTLKKSLALCKTVSCHCNYFQSSLQSKFNIYTTFINDIASFIRDSTMMDELNFYVASNYTQLDKKTMIIKEIEKFNQKLINSNIHLACQECQLVAKTLISIGAGNAIVSLYSPRYDPIKCLQQDY